MNLCIRGALSSLHNPILQVSNQTYRLVINKLASRIRRSLFVIETLCSQADNAAATFAVAEIVNRL